MFRMKIVGLIHRLACATLVTTFATTVTTASAADLHSPESLGRLVSLEYDAALRSADEVPLFSLLSETMPRNRHAAMSDSRADREISLELTPVSGRLFGGRSAGNLSAACGEDCFCSDPCAGESCLDQSCLETDPIWKFRAAAVFLERDRNRAFTIVNTPPGVEAFNSSQFNYGVETGIDLSMQRQLWGDYGVELRYFGLDGWSSQGAVNIVPFGGSFPTFVAPTGFATLVGGDIQFESRTQLHSGEISLTRQFGPIQMLAGFRHIELGDQMDCNMNILNPFPIPPARIVISNRLQNHLSGFQLGADAELLTLGDWFRVDSFIKGGIYQNLVNYRAGGRVGTTDLGRASGRNMGTAFSVETGFMGVIQFHRPHFDPQWIPVALACQYRPGSRANRPDRGQSDWGQPVPSG